MFQLTQQQKDLRKELRAFVDKEIIPQAEALDASREFPRKIFKLLGKMGYLDLSFYNLRPQARYGSIESMIIMEEIARGLPSMTLSMSPHVQCMNLIHNQILMLMIILFILFNLHSNISCKCSIPFNLSIV